MFTDLDGDKPEIAILAQSGISKRFISQEMNFIFISQDLVLVDMNMGNAVVATHLCLFT